MSQLKLSNNTGSVSPSHGLQRLAPDVVKRVVFPYILDALKNLQNPSACAGTLLYSVSQVALFVQPYVFDKDSMAKHDALWSTLYNFVIAKRTDDEFIRMNKTFSVCACNTAQRREKLIHNAFAQSSPNGSSSSHTGAFISFTCHLLRSILEFTKDVPVTKGVGKRWPSSVSQLIPLDSDQVVISLSQWQRFTGNLVVLDLFPAVIRLGGPAMYDSVIKHDAMNTVIIEPVRRGLDEVFKAVEQEPKGTTKFPSRRVYGVVDKMSMGLHSCIEELFRQPIRSNIRMLNGGETRALHLCSTILYLLPLLENNLTGGAMAVSSLTEMLSQDSTYLFRDFKMGHPARPDIPLHPKIVQQYDRFFSQERGSEIPIEDILRQLEQLGELPYEDFVAFSMVQSHKARPCATSDCDRTFKGTSNGFQKCSGCSIVGYCSRECQEHDWKPDGEKYPHRQACKIMSRIMKKWKSEGGGWHVLPPGIEEFHPEAMRASAQRRELEKVIIGMRKKGEITEKELAFMMGWSTRTSSEIDNPLTGTGLAANVIEWHPGYDDYESMIGKIVQRFNGPEPAYIDRTMCSEDEKAKTRAALANHPFWKQVMNP
ncbi:hypothetical protein BJ165DRAFT_110673 [Panaeolus papilionaceus]|nr:hypothetical protein BJ165DRAFT_110673 [Panaeolus papilionaceus]